MRRIRGVLEFGVLILVVLCAGGTSSASPGTFVVFAENYQRAPGKPATSTETFTVLRPGAGYTLRVINGDEGGRSTRVDSAVVFLNGIQILGPSDFNANVTRLERVVRLEGANTLAVELRGSPGSFITIVVDAQDSVPPIIQGTANPPPNLNGWNNANVTVSFTCSDALSGIASCPGPTTLTTSGANQMVTGTAVDNAGNTATATVKVNLDRTSPGITTSAVPAANVKGWNDSDVTVTFTCSDSLSGIASCSGPTTLSTSGANQLVTGTVVDNAGNTATATAKINLDKASPAVAATAAPAANANGWNNTDVTVTFTCSDSLSGTATCPSPTTLSTSGANQSVSGTTTDNAGNSGTTTVSVNLDKASPSIAAASTPAANANGWNNTDVTVSFTCADTLSGIANCPSPVTVAAPGASQTISGIATDKAGNTANATALINLDKAPPALSMSPSASTVSSAALTLGGTAPDALSGLMSVKCNNVDATLSGSDFTCAVNLSEGPNTIQIRAFDCAGNSATTSVDINFATFIPPPPGPTAVTWINPVGVIAAGNSLTKTNSSAAWDSGADSAQVLPDGYGFVEFTATETTTTRMGGLGATDSNQSYTDVDYGVMLRSDGSFAVFESGANRGEFGSYAANDRFRVEVRYRVVRYLRNGVLLFTSPTTIQFPLRVDTAFLTLGGTLTDVRVGNLVWTDSVGARISGESLIKTAAVGWNAGAISTNTIESGDGFLEFSAAETNTSRIAGLANLVTGVAVSDIRFGILLKGNGTVEIVESGTSRGVFGPYFTGDRFRVELRIGVVRYFKNGVQLYTSSDTPSYPLRADSALDTPGATLTDVTLQPLGWLTTQSVYANGALLIKKTADGWTTAASSGFSLQSGDGYVEFTAIETNSRRGLGMKSGASAQSIQQIDYLICLNETGTVEVIELGISRGLFGSYRNGDRFRIEIQNGVIRYRKNGALLFSSVVPPAYPLHAEAALYSQDATLVDIDLGDLAWTNGVNIRVAGRSLIKTSSITSWDAGAVSTRTTTSGYVEFTASETSTFRIAGLSNGDSDQNYTDIDFAILLRSDSSVAIYEAGNPIGVFGAYVPGDRFRVEVQAGTVRYWKNGALLYTSLIHPIAPLRIDTALHGGNATLFNIVFR